MRRAPTWTKDLWDLPHATVRTTHGRVVYGRAKREFKAKDLWRIAKSVEVPTAPLEMVFYLRTMLVMWAKLGLHDPAEDESFQEFIGAEIAAELEAAGHDPAEYGYVAPEPDPYADLPSGRRWWEFWKPPFPTD